METGLELVFRDCALVSMLHQCGAFLFEGEKYKGCLSTCEEDACNHGNSVLPTHWTLMVAMVTYFMALLALQHGLCLWWLDTVWLHLVALVILARCQSCCQATKQTWLMVGSCVSKQEKLLLHYAAVTRLTIGYCHYCYYYKVTLLLLGNIGIPYWRWDTVWFTDCDCC